MSNEKRRCGRLRAKENSFAALVEGQEHVTVGSLVDISENGLAFEYITEQELENIGKIKFIEIFVLGNVFHMDNIPCRVVYDSQVETTFLRRFKTKRCGVRFCDFDAKKNEQLRNFLNNYTSGMCSNE